MNELMKQIVEKTKELERLSRMSPMEFSDYIRKEKLVLTPKQMWTEGRGVVKVWTFQNHD